MASSVSVVVAVILVLVAAAVGVAVGYELSPRAAQQNAATKNDTLSIVGAGTLGTYFPQMASLLVNTTPGISAPLASQQYEGSLLALGAIASLHQTFDVAAAADYRLIPQILEPTYANYEVIFGTTPEVLTYDSSNASLIGINATNWATKVEQPGLKMGVANASTDPNGYNEIFSLQLEGLATGGNLSSVYGHFFSGAPGAPAVANPASTRVEPETMVATLLSTHVVSSFITYRSYAVAHHLSYVNMSANVGLGNLDAADVSTYGMASTTIIGSSGPVVIHGAPVAFSVTVPLNAPNPSLGASFIALLFTPAGQVMLAANGFTPISPGWSDHPSNVPTALPPDVTVLPSGLPPVA
ncbi:MAG: substrate-binding domain-containing protein [Thermoplasmata archaeon]|nr:substrate-binding domain-containing protein [Thermoplasmata archaeon]